MRTPYEVLSQLHEQPMNNLHKGAANNVTGFGSVHYEMNKDS